MIIFKYEEREILTGTSGWMYRHWKGTFYPDGFKGNQLIYYTGEFKTVELNYSFYRMPGAKAYTGWYEHTPAGFIFAVKMNRYITHLKRLIVDDESETSLRNFLQDTQGLKEKLGVILIQLHPRQEINPERLENFLSVYTKITGDLEFKPETCIEFRNASWFAESIYEILHKNNISLVFPSTPEFRRLVFTADFAYIRIHGYNSWTGGMLKKLKAEIDSYPEKIKRVYVYFNNDYNTYAIYNAREFLTLI
ncbi:MAG: DUF72 domain-containing protein [Syntrophothermus sp.]